MTTFDTKIDSRDDSAPVNLFHFRGAEDSEFQLERLIRSVNIIPGTTEFGYGVTTVYNTEDGIENSYAGGPVTDFRRSMEQLIKRTPNLTHVSLVVAWHGDDLRIGECQIRPRVDRIAKETTPYSWQVGSEDRFDAFQVSYNGHYEFEEQLDFQEYNFSGTSEVGEQLYFQNRDRDVAEGDSFQVTIRRGFNHTEEELGDDDNIIYSVLVEPFSLEFIKWEVVEDYTVYVKGYNPPVVTTTTTGGDNGGTTATTTPSTDPLPFVSMRTYLYGPGAVPHSGGTPSDRSTYEAIAYCKSLGLEVTVYPFILMDVPDNNGKPSPYGGGEQPSFPWRGRITCNPAPGYAGTVDKTNAATTQVSNFFGTASASDFGWDSQKQVVNYAGPDEWSFRRHILHIAQIAAVAGADDFLIGTEMVSMTKIRSDATAFPAVDQLVSLLGQVRSILGNTPKVSYAADWSEYNSYRPQDGSNDVHFHLDKLWSDSRIDYIGIDNYMAMADWRVGENHIDKAKGVPSIYDLNYLRGNVMGGEDFDYFYASQADRDSQIRTPITDGLGKPWTFRQKDIPGWWGNQHIPRIGGVETGTATAWVPESKPIVFTELGCSAANRGANEPNAFVDVKSIESRYPRYSLGVRDDLMQRSFLEASLSFWEQSNPISSVYSDTMLDIDKTSIWCWDSRPYPDFPTAVDFWGDAPNWDVGHWLDGRIHIPNAISGTIETFRYTDAVRDVTYGGHVYQAVPVKPGKIKTEGTLEQSSFQIELGRDSGLATLFREFRPAHPVLLTILQGHLTDDDALFVPRWSGRITSTKRKGDRFEVVGIPSSTALARTGLTRNYQIGCPHVLYGPLCKADKQAATTSGTVSVISGTTVTLNSGWNTRPAEKYVTGFVEWNRSDSRIERRRILAVAGNDITVSGPLSGLEVSETVSILLGCGQTVGDCRDLHGNIQNCGACPVIPIVNPMGGSTNNFY